MVNQFGQQLKGVSRMISNEIFREEKKKKEISKAIKLINEGKKTLDDYSGVMRWIIERRLGGKQDGR